MSVDILTVKDNKYLNLKYQFNFETKNICFCMSVIINYLFNIFT